MKSTAPSKPSNYKHASRIAWRKVADEAVILNTETAAYYSLDGVGLRLWELLGEKRSMPDIVSTLAKEYDAPAEVIRKDCTELVRKLRQEHIVEPA